LSAPIVLVANRGEIARRVLRTVRRMGYRSIAVHSEPDAGAPALAEADFIVPLGGVTPAESYLDIEKILAAGRRHASAGSRVLVHPGYGFLSENARFAEAVEAEGWLFLGPTAASITAMGDKTAALVEAREAGVPIIPSHVPEPGSTPDPQELIARAREIGLPLMVKAAAGGGGKGMRIARTEAELPELVSAAAREALGAFGDGRLFLERYLEGARHVEVQLLGDGAGKAIAIGERDCSIQRRHQKLVEESPAPGLMAETRAAMHAAAIALAERVDYRGAGTVEFILASSGEFYFLEMNTRLQVEHPVSELVHGIDLVEAQIRIAEGDADGSPFDLGTLGDLSPRGHAIELRVYAEDPANGFLPSIGRLDLVHWADDPGVRVDAGVVTGQCVTIDYDPMLAKLIAHGADRAEAIDRLRAAIAGSCIAGVETTLAFGRELIGRDDFRRGDVFTTFIAERMPEWQRPEVGAEWRELIIAASRHLRVETARGPTGGPRTLPTPSETLDGWRHLG
jgi:acetyl/propionyl-CoA carboxylase alpha subunit